MLRLLSKIEPCGTTSRPRGVLLSDESYEFPLDIDYPYCSFMAAMDSTIIITAFRAVDRFFTATGGPQPIGLGDSLCSYFHTKINKKMLLASPSSA